MGAQSHININIFVGPKDAPNYRVMGYEAVELTQANIVRNGTVEGRSTVDLVFHADDGKQFAMMLTGRLIRNLANLIGDEG